MNQPEASGRPDRIEHTKLFIDGAFTDSGDGGSQVTMDPATARPIVTVSSGGREDIGRAVEAARRALPAWSNQDIADRVAIIERAADLLDDRADALGALEALDTGKPLAEATAQAHAAADSFRYWARVACELRSVVVPTTTPALNYTLREPVGVVGVITPWNYPLLLYAEAIPGALAIGNTTVLKPSEDTPLTALHLAAIFSEAGLPPGALNVVAGEGPKAGAALVDHEDVAAIVFTGSTAVGREIAANASRSMKPLVLELGGKSPNVVFADADLDLALRASLFTFTTNQGQLCTAGTRLLIEERVHDEFAAELVRCAESLVVGDPFDPRTQLGSLISARQLSRVEHYVESGKREGGVVVSGGRRPLLPAPFDGGSFYAPTVFTGVSPGMRIARDEIFGPVVCLLPFVGLEHAAQLANDSAYGLNASVWTNDLNRAHRLAEMIDSGTVYINTVNGGALAPHDRYKGSGIGITGGREQIANLTRLKSVYVNLGGDVPGH